MATLPIPGLLAEFKILGLQAMDFGAQLSHFRARVLHWGDQLREEMTGKTDLCQLVDHDQLGLAEIAPEGKGLVLFHPEQKTQKARDGQRFTAEVEEFLQHHPDIAEVAVLGLPDAKFGEIVAAWIVPRAGAALSPEAIQTYCRGQITHFKIPQHIAIVQSLPRTVTGKVRKYVLKAQAIAELGLDEVAAIQTA